MRINELLDRKSSLSERLQRGAAVARGGAARDPRARALLPDHARAPGRRRRRLAGRDAAGAGRARQGRGGVHARRRVPAARTSTASSSSKGWSTEPPADLCSRTLIFLDCGNIDRTPAEQLKRDDGGALIVNIDHHHDNTRFGTINHVDPHASCTAEMVWDLMHGLGVRDHAGDRRGAVRRPGHRHRPLHVREHRPAGARDGGRADRRRRRRARDLPAPLRGHPAGQARAARARAHQRRALRRRPADADAPDPRRLPPRPAPTRATPRASSTTCARSRARRSPGSCATSSPSGAAARKVSLRATDDRIDVSRIARAGGGGGHRRAAGFSTDLEFPELVDVPAASSVADQL